VALLGRMHDSANVERAFAAAGGPWEFNLRDLLRWCDLATAAAAAGSEAMELDGGGGAARAARLQAAALHYARMLFAQRLRTAADRQHVARLVAEVFGPEEAAAAGFGGAAAAAAAGRDRPSLLLSPELLVVGEAAVARAGGGGGAAEVSEAAVGARVAAELALLPAQLALLESLAQCVQRGWMCLLVGPGAAGKTSLARCLAALCGRQLLEVPMTNGEGAAACCLAGSRAVTAVLAGAGAEQRCRRQACAQCSAAACHHVAARRPHRALAPSPEPPRLLVSPRLASKPPPLPPRRHRHLRPAGQL
jgi:hypothetical protein